MHPALLLVTAQIRRDDVQVGVKFDEPLGSNDGTVKGVKIFDCEAGYGAFVRGKNVSVGDYPERDILDEVSDDEDESAPATEPAAAAAEDEDEI